MLMFMCIRYFVCGRVSAECRMDYLMGSSVSLFFKMIKLVRSFLENNEVGI